eukprot:jgi/Psemu1/211102/e_gw1.554.43.1
MAAVFFSLVAIQIVPRFSLLFLSMHGWSHRVAGCIHFVWLLVGAMGGVVSRLVGSNSNNNKNNNNNNDLVLAYDLLLGCSGVVTTLTAARDFPHRHVTNVPGRSGTLHRTAIVTQSEMIEHSFYQALNLAQSMYLHALHRIGNGDNGGGGDDQHRHLYCLPIRLVCLWAVTAPWLVRHRFPVHSFSQNWSLSQSGSSRQGEVLLYRIKKAQYVFYKHVILHGLNISVALQQQQQQQQQQASYDYTYQAAAAAAIPYVIEWRVFWLLLNTSYVMEFFLQTLVKRHVLSQSTMMVLQKLLMTAASLSAASVLTTSVRLRVGVCVASFVLNVAHRHHDVVNTLCIAAGALLWDRLVAVG